MAAGEYRVIELAEVRGRPGEVRLTLQAQVAAVNHTPTASASATDASSDAQWELRLPRAVAERERLAPGRMLRAAQQPYGVSFALSEEPRPFFLVLADEWQRELPARPVPAPGGA